MVADAVTTSDSDSYSAMVVAEPVAIAFADTAISDLPPSPLPLPPSPPLNWYLLPHSTLSSSHTPALHPQTSLQSDPTNTSAKLTEEWTMATSQHPTLQ